MGASNDLNCKTRMVLSMYFVLKHLDNLDLRQGTIEKFASVFIENFPREFDEFHFQYVLLLTKVFSRSRLIRPQLLLINKHILRIVFQRYRNQHVREFLVNIFDFEHDTLLGNNSSGMGLLLDQSFLSSFMSKLLWSDQPRLEDIECLSSLMRANYNDKCDYLQVKKSIQVPRWDNVVNPEDGDKVDWFGLQIKQKKAFIEQMKRVVTGDLIRLVEQNQDLLFKSDPPKDNIFYVLTKKFCKKQAKMSQIKYKMMKFFNPLVSSFIRKVRIKRKQSKNSIKRASNDRLGQKKQLERRTSARPNKAFRIRKQHTLSHNPTVDWKSKFGGLSEIDFSKLQIKSTKNTKLGFFQKIKKIKTRKRNTLVANYLQTRKENCAPNARIGRRKASRKHSVRKRSQEILGNLAPRRRSKLSQRRQSVSRNRAKKPVSKLQSLGTFILFKSDLTISSNKELIDIEIRKFYRHCLQRPERPFSAADFEENLEKTELVLQLYQLIFSPHCGDDYAQNRSLLKSLFRNLNVMLYILFEAFVHLDSVRGSEQLITKVCQILTSCLSSLEFTLEKFINKRKQTLLFSFQILQSICVFFFNRELARVGETRDVSFIKKRVLVLGNSVVGTRPL